MLELPGISIDGFESFKPVSLLRGALKLSLETERYSIDYFQNGAHPSGTVEYPESSKATIWTPSRKTFGRPIRDWGTSTA
jgi:phage portal protein BeeE